MRRLSEFELAAHIARMQREYVRCRAHLPPEAATRYGRAARLEFPLGELTNTGLAGFLWTWQRQGRLQVAAIDQTDSFNAQGLEGKCVVPTVLSTALLAARELPPYRRVVYVERKGGPGHESPA